MIIDLILLVGLVVVGTVIMKSVFRLASATKRMAAGVAIQHGPVRSVWRDLPLPIEVNQLREKSEREAVYILPGARVAVAAQWLENTWGRAGYILVPTEKDGALRKYVFQRREAEGVVLVVIMLVPPQFAGAAAVTSVVISDQRLNMRLNVDFTAGYAAQDATPPARGLVGNSTRRTFISGLLCGAIPFIAGGVTWRVTDATGFSDATQRIIGYRFDSRPITTWQQARAILTYQFGLFVREVYEPHAPIGDKISSNWGPFNQKLDSWLPRYPEFQDFYSWYYSLHGREAIWWFYWCEPNTMKDEIYVFLRTLKLASGF